MAASLVLQATGKTTGGEPLKIQAITGYGTDNAPIAIASPASFPLTIKSDTARYSKIFQDAGIGAK